MSEINSKLFLTAWFDNFSSLVIHTTNIKEHLPMFSSRLMCRLTNAIHCLAIKRSSWFIRNGRQKRRHAVQCHRSNCRMSHLFPLSLHAISALETLLSYPPFPPPATLGPALPNRRIYHHHYFTHLMTNMEVCSCAGYRN